MGCTTCNKSIVGQAASLAGAGARVVSAVVTGQPVQVSPDVRAARLAACLKCEFVSVSDNGAAHQCSQCGCWLDGKLLCKACLATEDCPKGFWPKEVTP